MAAQKDIQYRQVATPYGVMAFAARGAALIGVILPDRNGQRLAREIATRWPGARRSRDLLPVVARQIRDYFAGRLDRFEAKVDLGSRSAFQKRILQACRQIPAGSVVTYGELARRAGHCGAARAVGRAMATNPVPLVIPCHRVVAADGRLCGFSAAGGLALKRRLLEHEARRSETRRHKSRTHKT
jgi:methylated-DNA-[protein]-cysteine S-methyltransferase